VSHTRLQRADAVNDDELLPRIVRRVWDLLDAQHVGAHYSAAEMLLRLQTLPVDHVTPIVLGALRSRGAAARDAAHERFALLWRLAGEIGGAQLAPETLLAMLDALVDEQPGVRLTGQSWLADSISHAERILDPLLQRLLAPTSRRVGTVYAEAYNAADVLYVFGKLRLIVECDFQLFMRQMSTKPVNSELVRMYQTLEIPADGVDADDMADVAGNKDGVVIANRLYHDDNIDAIVAPHADDAPDAADADKPARSDAQQEADEFTEIARSATQLPGAGVACESYLALLVSERVSERVRVIDRRRHTLRSGTCRARLTSDTTLRCVNATRYV
jgi:hypothetical protein